MKYSSRSSVSEKQLILPSTSFCLSVLLFVGSSQLVSHGLLEHIVATLGAGTVVRTLNLSNGNRDTWPQQWEPMWYWDALLQEWESGPLLAHKTDIGLH